MDLDLSEDGGRGGDCRWDGGGGEFLRLGRRVKWKEVRWWVLGLDEEEEQDGDDKDDDEDDEVGEDDGEDDDGGCCRCCRRCKGGGGN